MYFDDPKPISSSSGEGRVAELDSLRGLAALGILVFHAYPHLLPCGWAAVDLFFVLSGYLITAIILRSGWSPGFLGRFYIRRGLRVWPIFYLSVAVVAAASPWLNLTCKWRGLWAMLTFTPYGPSLSSVPTPLFSPYLGHTWTLAIEEQFYLVWPALVLLAGRRRVAWLALVCLAGSVLARSQATSPMTLLGRADGLALGGLLAAIMTRFKPDGPYRVPLLALFAASAALSVPLLQAYGFLTDPNAWGVLARSPVVSILVFNTFWFGVVGLTICGSGRPVLALLRLWLLRNLGLVSYGLYLYHWPILSVANQIAKAWRLPGRPFWLDAVMLITCFTVAWLSWVGIERPILRLKDRFSYTPTLQRTPPHSPRTKPMSNPDA